MMSSNCIHLASHHSLWLSNTPVFIYTKYCMTHSSLVGYQVCFQSLAIVNTAAMNTSVQVFLLYPVLFFFWLCARSCITALYGGSSSSSLRNLCTVFHSGCASLHCYCSVKAFLFLHILARICCC
jgi:hypothetical protein